MLLLQLISLLLSLIFVFIFVIFIYLRWHFNFWQKRHVLGPQPQLFVGTFPKSNSGQCNLIEELHEIYLRYKKTQRFVGVFAARKPILFILDPILANEILTTNFKYFHDNESSKWTTTDVEKLRLFSPFVSTGAEWKERRTQLTPVLAVNRLRTFYKNARCYAKKINDEISSNLHTTIDVKMLANHFTSMFMANFIWSIDANSVNNVAATDVAAATAAVGDINVVSKTKAHNIIAGKAATAASAAVTKIATANEIALMAQSMITQSLNCVRYFGRTANWPWLRKLKPVRFFPKKTELFFRQLAADVVNARLNANNNAVPVAVGINSGVAGVAVGGAVGGSAVGDVHCIDVIQHLLHLCAKKHLNDLQIAGHTTTTLIDGYETAAILIAHCLLLLSRNLRVQQKLRVELQNAIEENVEILRDYNALNALPYLELCLLETLRIFPPLPTLFKICTAAINLKNYDDTFCALKPNDLVYISTYSFQRDAGYFEHPDEFWPERFDEHVNAAGGARKYREMGVFLPFGDGPRMCPGMKLGLMEAKVAVAEIVRNFSMICAPNTRKDNKIAADSFLLTIDGELHVIFENIK